MIRYATTADYPQIEALWVNAFGDSVEYIRSYWDNIGQPEKCLVVELNQQIVSMLFLLPATLSVGDEWRNVSYIYACATSPSHRRQGLMHELLTIAFKRAVEENQFAQILIPANRALSLYYKKIGFETFFSQNQFTEINVDFESAISLTKESITRIVELRKWFLNFEFAVQWPDDYLRFALNELRQCGAKVILKHDSYTLLSPENSVLESMPIHLNTTERSEEYALILFCHSEKLSINSLPYFNFGLD